jgi:hypothetical protein
MLVTERRASTRDHRGAKEEDSMEFLVEFELEVKITPLEPHPNDPALAGR